MYICVCVCVCVCVYMCMCRRVRSHIGWSHDVGGLLAGLPDQLQGGNGRVDPLGFGCL